MGVGLGRAGGGGEFGGLEVGGVGAGSGGGLGCMKWEVGGGGRGVGVGVVGSGDWGDRNSWNLPYLVANTDG